MTGSGIISKFIGFFYKVFLSHTIGASGLGLYQLVFPIFTLCLALSASGIQTAVSRYVAIEKAKGFSGRIYLALGLFVSTTLSVILMLLVHAYAPWLAENILTEARAADLLKVMSFSLIPASIHACFNGYYYGKKDSTIPSLCQIMEQIFRVGGTYVIYLVLSNQKMPLLAIHAVWGLVLSEVAGLLVSLTAFLWQTSGNTAAASSMMVSDNTMATSSMKASTTTNSHARLSATASNIHHFGSTMRHHSAPLPLYPLVVMALPLTLNHVLVTLTHSLENLLIPQQLVAFGYTSEEALSHFGILSGMAMSVIMAPTALTGSLCVLLLPRISEAKAACNSQLISDTIKGAASCGIALGSLCTFLFLFSADWIGAVLFDNPLAGFYIQILSILCPFFYTSMLLNSIVGGLGHAGLSLLCNLSGCAVRIIGIWFFMPTYGMYAYIIALVASFVLTMAELILVVFLKCRK